MKLELQLSPKQDDALTLLSDKVTRFLLFGGGAGGAKSWLGCVWLILMCWTYAGTRWFIGRDELKKIMTTTILTFQKVSTFLKLDSKLWTLDSKYNFILFSNGSRIDLLDLKFLPSDPLYSRLGSYEFTGGWIEEGQEVHYLAVEMLKTRIGRQLNDKYDILPKILTTGNPAKNWMYRWFYKPWKDNVLPLGYAFIRALLTDNPFLDSGYRESIQQLTDPVQRARLLHGSWEYESDPTALIPYEAILEMFSVQVDDGLPALVCDVARFGKDRTTVSIWNGWRAIKLLEKTKQKITDTATWINELSTEYHVPRSRMMIDEDGVGGGVVDLLPGANGFTANASPYPIFEIKDGEEVAIIENYANRKAQCSYRFANRVNARAVSVQAPSEIIKQTVIEEVEQLKRSNVDKDAKLAILSKDKVKDILQRSPDYLDVLVMREALELLPKQKYAMETKMQHNTVVGGVPWEHLID